MNKTFQKHAVQLQPFECGIISPVLNPVVNPQQSLSVVGSTLMSDASTKVLG